MAAEPDGGAWTKAPACAVAVGAALAGALAPLYADGGAARPANWWWIGAPAVVVALAACVAARSGPRSSFALAALFPAASAVAAIWLFVLDVRSGTPGGILPVLACCGLIAAFALLIAAWWPSGPATGIEAAGDTAEATDALAGPVPGAATDDSAVPIGGSQAPGPGRVRPWAPVTALAVTVVVATGLGLVTAPAAQAWTETGRTAQAATVPDLPRVPGTAVAWSQSAPTATESFPFYRGGVVSAGTGFVTALGYPGAPDPGIAGVDGATGALRWTFALGEATPYALAASPDGRYVMAVFSPHSGHRSSASRLVVLDAVTGRRLWSRTVRYRFDGGGLAPTTTTLAVFADDVLPAGSPSTLLGLDLATGDVKWRASAPQGCSFSIMLATATPTAVLKSERCSDRTARLVALDEATGAERWRYTTIAPGAAPATWGVMDIARTGPGGTAVFLRRSVSEADTDVVLLDAVDGSVITKVALLGYAYLGGPVGAVLGGGESALLLPGATSTTPVPSLATECPVVRDVASSSGSITLLCRDRPAGQQYLLVQPADPGAPAVRLRSNPEPDQIVMARGALVGVTANADTVTYVAHR